MLGIFSNLAPGEIGLALLVALLIFGRRLPQVLMDLARQFYKLRRALFDLRKETGIDEELRKVQHSLREAEFQVRQDHDRQAQDPERGVGAHPPDRQTSWDPPESQPEPAMTEPCEPHYEQPPGDHGATHQGAPSSAGAQGPEQTPERLEDPGGGEPQAPAGDPQPAD